MIRLDDKTLTAEAEYPINFTQWGKRFVLNLHSNRSYSLFSYLLIIQKNINSKQKTQK